MNRAREELKNLYQEPGELITVFICKYGQMHYLSTGIRAHRETHPFAITGFITALEPKLNKMVVRKYVDARDKPDTLEAIFQMAWNNAPRKCWRLILLIIAILSGFHPPSMRFQRLM